MSDKYRVSRNYQNLTLANYGHTGGIFDFPEIPAINNIHESEFIGWNYATGLTDTTHTSVHFFLDDHRFECVWNNPDKYIEFFKKFDYVCSPDFSVYIDFPFALQIYNHYRNQWLGRYWSDNGVKIIPSVFWGDEETYIYAFEGIPKNSAIAITSVGTQKSKNSVEYSTFLKGFNVMMEELEPTQIVWHGKIPDDIDISNIDIIKVKTESDLRKERNI